jgi:hypothetical protein
VSWRWWWGVQVSRANELLGHMEGKQCSVKVEARSERIVCVVIEKVTFERVH